MTELLTIKLIVLLALVVMTGVALAAGKISRKGGIYEEVLTLKNGNKMLYTLFIPESYSQQPVPLVLSLHYGGTVTPYFGRGVLAYLVEPGLRDLEAIMVAPDCPGKGWDNPESESAVLQLLDDIKEHYHIDEKRVVVTGFSMGGIGTWYLAARHPEVFSAAIPIAGATDAETAAKIGDIPLYVIHSRVDRVLPIGPTEEVVATLKARGKKVEFVALKSVDHYNTSGFTYALKGAIPWLKKIWEKKD